MKLKYYKNPIRYLLHSIGFDLVCYKSDEAKQTCPANISELTFEIFLMVKEYTMTGPERVNALVDAVKYIIFNQIEGAFVECGVWKGGSVMAMAHVLNRLRITDREIFLYDTFTGMTVPTVHDVSFKGYMAQEKYPETLLDDKTSKWCCSSLEEVRANVLSTNYSINKFKFVVGKVEETIPANIPEKIALLRLDTDWYESTKHELFHLFPLLQPNGVIIVDDYGHWQGAKKAVDEYFTENRITILLNRIDNTARIGIKTIKC